MTKQLGYSPKESPDATRVYYVRRKPEDGNLTNQIWSVAADGGDERYVTSMTTNASWAPARGGSTFLTTTPPARPVDGSRSSISRAKVSSESRTLIPVWVPEAI
jgi:hypothetical protein